MKHGTLDLLALFFGTLSFVVGNVLLLAPYFLQGAPHSNVRDLIGAGLLGFAFVCVLPAKIDRAASVFRKVNPLRRSSDVTVQRGDPG